MLLAMETCRISFLVSSVRSCLCVYDSWLHRLRENGRDPYLPFHSLKPLVRPWLGPDLRVTSGLLGSLIRYQELNSEVPFVGHLTRAYSWQAPMAVLMVSALHINASTPSRC